MINLIPNKEKKEMAKDFYLRVITLSFFMLGISFLVSSILLLPSYIVSSSEKVFFNGKLQIQKSEVVSLPDQNTLSIIKDLKNKLNLIENTKKNKILISQKIVSEIVLKKLPSIKITQISYEKDPQGKDVVNITGKAPNREVLLSFRRVLEDSPLFSKVDLPISNFIKGSDIKFYLTLVTS